MLYGTIDSTGFAMAKLAGKLAHPGTTLRSCSEPVRANTVSIVNSAPWSSMCGGGAVSDLSASGRADQDEPARRAPPGKTASARRITAVWMSMRSRRRSVTWNGRVQAKACRLSAASRSRIHPNDHRWTQTHYRWLE